MGNREPRLDPVYDSERGTGSTPPERGTESNSVTGRPATERPTTAFHQPAETVADERKPFNEGEALAEGGSFDSVAPPNQEHER